MAGESQLVQSVCAVVLKGHWNTLFSPNLSSFRLSSTTVAHVLRQLSRRGGDGPAPPWAFFKWLDSKPASEYSHSVHATWTMVHVLAEHTHFRGAQKLLEKMAHRELLSSPTVLSALIATTRDGFDTNEHVLSWLVIFYGGLRMTHDAIQVFEQMRVWGLKPHLHACTVLLSCLVRERLTDMAWRVYRKMARLGVAANVHVYNVLIRACGNAGDVERAERLVGEMEAKGVLPDVFTYNTLISLYCKRSLHYEALAVQHRMESAGVRPDIVTYNSLIYSFCREGRMREAVRLFREIKGAVPNEITYTTLIDGYCRLSDLDESLRLLEVMKAKGLYPGVVAYNAILRMLCSQGRLREGNKLLVEMSERKIEPDNVTCNTLINAYCKLGDTRSALRVKQNMLEAGLKLDVFTYRALIHGFCRVRDMENAKELLFAMLDAGFSPSSCTYSWIVDGFCDLEREDEITGLPDEFAKRGLCVDVSLCRALIRRLCKRERLGSAEKVFDFMVSKNLPRDCVVYTSLALAHLKAGKSDVATAILDGMYENKLMITRKIYRGFNGSYANDNEFVTKFWNRMVNRGLMSRELLKEMQNS